jgi:tRNA-dihydrouridine synthase
MMTSVSTTKPSWWESITNHQSPVTVMSPMVDQSELAFRQLCRQYNPNTLCYTPMLHAKRFVSDSTYRKNFFQTCANDRPLFAQFCGNDADTLIQASKLIENQVDGVDLNLGCPENIAKKGNYGSFLFSNPTLVVNIVERMVSELNIPITCKIRLMENGHHIPVERRGLSGTIHFCQELERVGCSMICVHARNRNNKGPKTSDSDWNALKRINESVTIPVVANGNISSFRDVIECHTKTGCAGVMSAEALLCDPTLFSTGETNHVTASSVALNYLNYAEQYPPSDFLKVVKPHLYRMLHGLIMMEEKEARKISLERRLQMARDVASCRAVVRDFLIMEESLSLNTEEREKLKLSWYNRHPRKTKKRKGGNSGVGVKKRGLTVQQVREAKKARKRQWLMSGTRMN